MEPIDLNAFKIQTDKIPEKQIQSRKTTQQSGFLKGPIPLVWVKAAGVLPGKACYLGQVLWYLVGLEKKRRVKLSRIRRKQFKIGEDASYRALKALEEAHLIAVERRRGASPMVTILEAPE